MKNTRLIFSIPSLIHNLSIIRNSLNNTKLLFVVKANGYGAGIIAIAEKVEEASIVDAFGVTHLEEGILLREKGIKSPILVMAEGFPENASYYGIFQLIPTVGSIEMAKALHEHGKNTNTVIHYHLKIDTGMHRYGVRVDDLDSFLEACAGFDFIKMEGVFSHLPSPTNTTFTHRQMDDFNKAIDKVKEYAHTPTYCHILNSEGFLLYPDKKLDMVRIGNLAYGMNPKNLKTTLPIVNPWTLRTYVSKVSTVKKGERYGYGQKRKAKKDMTIAVLPIGHADGFMLKPVDQPASFKEALKMATGAFAKFFGFVMDTVQLEDGTKLAILDNGAVQQTIIDVTDKNIKVGDPIEVRMRRFCLNPMIERIYQEEGEKV